MEKEKKCNKMTCDANTCSGLAYFLGFIGAVVYYISIATSFCAGVLGFLKAIVFPAFLVYEVLKFVGM